MTVEALVFAAVMAAGDVDVAAEVRGWASTVLLFLASVIGVVYAGRSARRNRREQHLETSTTVGPPTTQQVWERMDVMDERNERLERLLTAALAVLDEVVDALPPGYKPMRSHRHIATLQEAGYLPERLGQ